MLAPGVISHCTSVVEHPELVAERIVRVAKLVARENYMFKFPEGDHPSTITLLDQLRGKHHHDW